ncbi:MAG: cytosolic protein [Acidobacteria bacterium]|nr:cytosolic protein [Acidobacteriota bacterium]
MFDYQKIYQYLSDDVVSRFYEQRLSKLLELNLLEVLRRKNPYLFKAKNIEIPADLVRGILDAYLSAQEETMFGGLLENLAIFISKNVDQGIKSKFKSIDLEFKRNNQYFLVGIKSGPNWGNSDQLAQMKNNFKLARLELRKQYIEMEIIAVNGCIYGKERQSFKQDPDPDKTYYKYCGQEFWGFISGDLELYRKLIEPIDFEAKKKDEKFKEAYVKKLNEMTAEFMRDFLTDHKIDWAKLIDFVSKKE